MPDRKDIVRNLDGIGGSISKILRNQRADEAGAQEAKARNLEARKIWEAELAKNGVHRETNNQPPTTEESNVEMPREPGEGGV